MSMNAQGRPTGTGTSGFASTSGSSLLPNEPLLFETATPSIPVSTCRT